MKKQFLESAAAIAINSETLKTPKKDPSPFFYVETPPEIEVHPLSILNYEIVYQHSKILSMFLEEHYGLNGGGYQITGGLMRLTGPLRLMKIAVSHQINDLGIDFEKTKETMQPFLQQLYFYAGGRLRKLSTETGEISAFSYSPNYMTEILRDLTQSSGKPEFYESCFTAIVDLEQRVRCYHSGLPEHRYVH